MPSIPEILSDDSLTNLSNSLKNSLERESPNMNRRLLAMPRKPEPLEPWMNDAIQLMVRRNLSLRQAAQQLGQEITPQQADNIAGRTRFHDALEEARLAFYAEVGSNPRLTKDALIGKVYILAERLASDREDAKASEALFRLAKIQGWIAGEGGGQPSVVDLLARLLTQSDIDRLKADVKKAEEQGLEFDLAKAIVEIKAPKVN
jgi:hypothetical protein